MDEGDIKISNVQITGILEVEEGKKWDKNYLKKSWPKLPQIWCKDIQIHEFQQVQIRINKKRTMPRHIGI